MRRKIKQLRRIGAALQTLISACPGRGALQTCSIIEALTVPSRPHGEDSETSPSANNADPRGSIT